MSGDFRPDKHGEMKLVRKLPLKEDSLQVHPSDKELRSYYYGGPPLTTRFRPSFMQDDLYKGITHENFAETVVNTYMKAAPFNQIVNPHVPTHNFANAEVPEAFPEPQPVQE